MICLDADIQLNDNIDHLFDLPDIHFYAVTEASTVGGYDVPVDALINFTIWEMGNDPQVWENPDEFRPDWFLCDEVDLTGRKEIKLKSVGVGRRICPRSALVMMHVHLVVGRLVEEFVWENKLEEPIDLAEALAISFLDLLLRGSTGAVVMIQECFLNLLEVVFLFMA